MTHPARADASVRPLRASVKKLFALLGYTLVSTRAAPVATPPTRLATPTDAIYQKADVAFEVPLSKCCHPYLFSYGPEGWNPFVETLRDYGRGGHARYEGSILNRYYESFRPKTHLELFLGDLERDERIVQSRLSDLATDVYLPLFPWEPGASRTRGEMGLDASHGTQGYGPISEVKGRLEFARLTSTYDSIRRNGYRPTGAPDGDIRGYFLRRQGDYRFLVRAGLHRMAALSALDHDPIRVKFKQHHPRTIDLVDIQNWPQVRSGFLDAGVAETIFLRFFGDGGIKRARHLGLLSTPA